MADDVHTVTPGPDAVGRRLDRVLADALAPLARTRIKALIEAGKVTETGAQNGATIRDPSYRVKPHEAFEVTVPVAAPARPAAQAMALDILYEDEALIVVDKAAGLVVHPAPGNPDRTLVNALIAHCGDSLTGIGGEARPGIVHRLDKDTSGVMVVAKTAAAHANLSAQFAARSIDRSYRAVVWGRPTVTRIEGNIGRHRRSRKKMAVVETGGKPALTHIKAVSVYKRYRHGVMHDIASLLELRLGTGRTHQIRVHLAHIGHPVIGDPVYGRARARRPGVDDALMAAIRAACGRQALHAARLGFDHPGDGRRCVFESPLPADMAALTALLAGMEAGEKRRIASV